MTFDMSFVMHGAFLAAGLGLLLFSFFTGTRFMANDPFIPKAIFVLGVVAGVFGVMALSHGADIITGAGFLFGAFLVGLSTGMQLTRRPE
jgi:hypothetical protein